MKTPAVHFPLQKLDVTHCSCEKEEIYDIATVTTIINVINWNDGLFDYTTPCG
jgi:hypothetical protein